MRPLFKLLFLSLLFFNGAALYSQCNVQVSGTATSSFHTGDTIQYGTHHVCLNSYLFYFSNNPDTLYLEDQVTLTIHWSDNLVLYLDSGAVVNFSGSGNNIVEAVYYDSSVSYIDTAAFNIQSLNICAGLTYDYSLMATTPNQGCTHVATAELEMTEKNSIAAFPNPFSDQLTISLDAPMNIIITNSSGQVVMNDQLNSGLSVVQAEHWPSGIYFCRLENGEIMKVVKQ